MIEHEPDRHYSGEINRSRMYPNLNELAEMDLTEKASVNDRINSYGFTEHGHREIEARHDWEDQYVLGWHFRPELRCVTPELVWS